MNDLQQYFKKRNIRIREIAQETGYSVRYIYDLLSGYHKMRDGPRTRLMAVFPGIEPFLDLAVRKKYKKLDYLKQTLEYLRANPTDGCVEWPFACAPGDGYGRVWTGEKLVTVHRLAYALYHNAVISEYILHTCDNPPCFNPHHLYEGTQAQNLTDLRERGPSRFAFRRRQWRNFRHWR